MTTTSALGAADACPARSRGTSRSPSGPACDCDLPSLRDPRRRRQAGAPDLESAGASKARLGDGPPRYLFAAVFGRPSWDRRPSPASFAERLGLPVVSLPRASRGPSRVRGRTGTASREVGLRPTVTVADAAALAPAAKAIRDAHEACLIGRSVLAELVVVERLGWRDPSDPDGPSPARPRPGSRPADVGVRRAHGPRPPRPQHRYLWTDAFAVGNFLGLARGTGSRSTGQLALRLIDAVHHTLGRHRADDARRGWISGLGERRGRPIPPGAGCASARSYPERRPTEPFDEALGVGTRRPVLPLPDEVDAGPRPRGARDEGAARSTSGRGSWRRPPAPPSRRVSPRDGPSRPRVEDEHRPVASPRGVHGAARCPRRPRGLRAAARDRGRARCRLGSAHPRDEIAVSKA